MCCAHVGKLSRLCTCRMVCPEVRSAQTTGPVLVHVVTEKGRGYIPAETSQDKMHGVVKFDPRTGQQMSVSGSLVFVRYWMTLQMFIGTWG